MENKLSILIKIGILEIILLAFMGNYQPSSVQFMGSHAFKLGNRKIVIKAPDGMEIITQPEIIKSRLKTNESLAFAIVGDSSHHSRFPIWADYLQVGEYADINKLATFLEKDWSAHLIQKNIQGDRLTMTWSFSKEGHDSLFYTLLRYDLCYPYYLRLRTAWYANPSVPDYLNQGLSSIEVSK